MSRRNALYLFEEIAPCISTLKHLPIKQTTWFKDIIAESKILDTGVQGLNLGKI